MTRKASLAAIVVLAVAAIGTAFLSGALTTRAVQAPEIALDMVTAGNAYSDPGAGGDNSMTVGTTENCLTVTPGNTTAQHTHATHLVIRNVEDLIAFQVRLNYIGDQMRPSVWNPAPFNDSGLSQAVGFLNLPIDQTSFTHRTLTPASAIPVAPADGTNTPQTALVGASYVGTQDFPISPDTPAKATPDDTSYSAPSGGVLGGLILQVLGNESGNPSLFMNLDDDTPNPPGTRAVVWGGTAAINLDLAPTAMGDGYHGEGATCAALNCVTQECPAVGTGTPPPETPTATASPGPATPTATPTAAPGTPTATPTEAPGTPTATPTEAPGTPTATPTEAPGTPTATPTEAPGTPTATPTEAPGTPTATPTEAPGTPTATPTAAPATPTPTRTPGPQVGLDHFKCYDAERADGSPRFRSISVDTVDGFTDEDVRVGKPELVCFAVNKNGEGIIDEDAALVCYKLTGEREKIDEDVLVSNQFGDDQELHVHRGELLCVASGIDGGNIANIGAFKCYNAHPEKGSRIDVDDVVLEDRFGTDTVEIDQAELICPPATIDGQGSLGDTGLVCYDTDHDDDLDGEEVEIENQFGELTLELGDTDVLCVPSTGQVLPDDEEDEG